VYHALHYDKEDKNSSMTDSGCWFIFHKNMADNVGTGQMSGLVT